VAEAARHQEEVARTELLSLRSGAGTQTDYLRAEADLLRIRSALVEARNSEVAANIELARVTGELTTAWLDKNLENSR
jgi:outer membrane protein TolC